MFSNRTYFSEIYPIAKKYDAGKALKTFVMKIGVPEELTDYGSKDQDGPGTNFMKCCRRNDISLTGTKPEKPNQNPEEGLIREV